MGKNLDVFFRHGDMYYSLCWSWLKSFFLEFRKSEAKFEHYYLPQIIFWAANDKKFWTSFQLNSKSHLGREFDFWALPVLQNSSN
jgi:hypothetical protein